MQHHLRNVRLEARAVEGEADIVEFHLASGDDSVVVGRRALMGGDDLDLAAREDLADFAAEICLPVADALAAAQLPFVDSRSGVGVNRYRRFAASVVVAVVLGFVVASSFIFVAVKEVLKVMAVNAEREQLASWAGEWESDTSDVLMQRFDRCAALDVKEAIPFAATYAAMPAESDGKTNWPCLAARRFLKNYNQETIDAAIDECVKLRPAIQRTLKIALKKALE